MNKIHIIEDENELASILNDYLHHAGFETRITHNGLEAMEAFYQFQPDLILLDLMLPGQDGLTLCKTIRAKHSLPIIITTAKVEEIDRLLGLELGADDYICKPYSPREVVARVKAVLRRTQSGQATIAPQSAPTEMPAAPLQLDQDTLTASLYGQALSLTAVEFRLLQVLSKEPRRVFNREQLMDKIYLDQRIVSDRTIDSHITKLRKKLSAAHPGEDIIRSVYGVGYKFEAP